MRKFITLVFLSLCVAVGLQTLSAADADVAGKWHFILDTPGGDREVDAEFIVVGGKVTGKWGPSDVAGTYEDGKLTLAFPFTSEEAGETSTMKITAKLVTEALAGDWEFSTYAGSFKASRPK